MLSGGKDTAYRKALAAPHRPYSRIAIFSGAGQPLTNFRYPAFGKTRDGDLPFFSGSVSATLTSRVSRTLNFSVHESLYPQTVNDLLAPYGNFIRAYSGIELGDGSRRYSWQVFGGRIQDVTWDSGTGTCQVSCADFAADVIDNGFLQPVNSNVGQLATDQVKDLILGGYPAATFGTFDTFRTRMPQLTWESDRGAALDEVGQSLGAYWYQLANEDFVLRRVPWTVAAPPVVTLQTGAGGMITGFRASRSRADVYNAIAVTGERADGTTPVWAISRDMNAASPTFVNGNFGRRTKQAHLQTPSTQGQVQSVADDLLKSSRALTESWDLSIIPDASLELGDVIGIEVKGRAQVVVQVVSDFLLPLDASSDMSVSARSQVPGLLEVQ